MQSALDNTMDALGAEGGAAIPSGTSQMRTGDGRAELTFSSLTDAEMDDLGVSILPLETAPQPTPQTPPPTYSIIFDNVDFFIRPHYQSTRQANKSIHWIHHMAVEDRVPTNHLPRDKPTQPITDFDIGNLLPGQDTHDHMRAEFTVLGSRILTQYLDAFKPLSPVVVHHIPHQYSQIMSEASTDVSIK